MEYSEPGALERRQRLRFAFTLFSIGSLLLAQVGLVVWLLVKQFLH